MTWVTECDSVALLKTCHIEFDCRSKKWVLSGCY